MNPCCRIELFGGLRVLQQDRIITRFQTRQTSAVLAYLALHRERPQSRDLLMQIAWPDHEGSTDRHKLRVALNSLRRQLEPPGVPAGAVILADRHAVQLNPQSVSTDVAEFKAALQAVTGARGDTERAQCLAAAAALYGGELLPGLFEAWIVPERQRLAQAHLQVLEQLIAWKERTSDGPGAVEYARQAVAADPLREESHQQLIRLLAAAGRLEAARQQYHELQRLLAQELGEAPAAATETLLAAIEQHANRSETGVRSSVFDLGSSVVGSQPHPEPRTSNSERRAPIEAPLPAGTLTFLLVEFEGAPDMDQEVLRPLFRGYGGREVLGPDGVAVVAFGRASEAAAAALAGMAHVSRGASLSQPIHPDAALERSRETSITGAPPRMALDTGEVEPGDLPQQSPALELGTRLLLAAHPGQILLSEKSAALLRHGLTPGARLVDLGPYYLTPGLPPDRLFQVEGPEGLGRVNLPPRALPAGGGKLPLRLTRFFGREAEIEQLGALLGGTVDGGRRTGDGGRWTGDGGRWTVDGCDDRRPLPNYRPPSAVHRLITLTGPGGSGKTRLAQELMVRLRDPFQGAIWFVPLADLSDPGLIPDKIREVLELPRLPGVEPLEQVIEFLMAPRFGDGYPTLLLVDNLEQLLPGGAAMAATLLQRAQNLILLVTSRQRLNLPGEREFPVAPLPAPGEGEGCRVQGVGSDQASPTGSYTLHPTPYTLMQFPSVRLFVERAQAVRPDFQVTPHNAGAVASLCARLEGLPLAIELAAARVQVLAPAQMLARLEDRFALLVSRRRGLAARHQSLWAALDWSYQLLSAPLQRFFAQLSVFRGGWTAEAAEAICEEPASLDYLTQLRGYSLVLLEEGETELRYRMLETIREFGAEQLSPAERSALAHQHATYYADFAEQAELKLRGPEQVAWLNRLEAEHPNLRGALASSLEDSGFVDTALRLCVALQPFWSRRQHDHEGFRWVERALERYRPCSEPRAALLRARALVRAGELSLTMGNLEDSRPSLDRAQTLFEASLSLARELEDLSLTAMSLSGLGSVAHAKGGWYGQQTSIQIHGQVLALWRKLGNRPRIVSTLSQLAFLAYQIGDEEPARGYAQEALEMARVLGDRFGQEMPLGVLAQVTHRRSDLTQARAHREECLRIFNELGMRHGLAQVLNHLAQIAFDQGDDSAARAHYEQCVRFAREAGFYRFDLALALCGLGDVARRGDAVADARAFHEECWPMFHQFGYLLGAVHSLTALGEVTRRAGDLAAARGFLRQSLTILQAWPNEWRTVECLEESAALLVAQSQEEPAARLLAAAAALREVTPLDPRPTPGHPRYPRTSPDALARRLQAAFPVAWADGRRTSRERAGLLALELLGPP